MVSDLRVPSKIIVQLALEKDVIAQLSPSKEMLARPRREPSSACAIEARQSAQY